MPDGSKLLEPEVGAGFAVDGLEASDIPQALAYNLPNQVKNEKLGR